MKINIRGAKEAYELNIQNITNLFFEENEVVFDYDGETDIVISFKDQHNKIIASLMDKQTKQTYESDAEKDPDVKDKKKFIYTYVLVLQQYTGMEQPWGVLTGIRPTKLLHQKLQNGVPREQIHHQLAEDYLLDDEKIELMQEIVDRQLTAVPDLYDLSNEVSIYIGIPYCPTKCAYCTFPAYAITGKQGDVNSFLYGLHYEIREIGKWLTENQKKVTTIYFGGGTPTSITAEEMDELYEVLFESIPTIDQVREITVEAGRPDTITPEKLNVLKKWGIDRISINPQSYTQETLQAIGRHHTVEETIEKFHVAREMGMNNINMDLIIGLPGEGVAELEHSLEETAKLLPESLTVHTLSFKRASAMTKQRDKYKVADREEINEMMDMASNWMKENAYAPYYLYRQKNILGNLENVGYSLKGKESIYNIMIMEEKQTILGLGCGAASKFVHPQTGKISRFANPKEPKAFNENFEKYTRKKIELLEELFN